MMYLSKVGFFLLMGLSLSSCKEEQSTMKAPVNEKTISSAVMQKDGYSNIANDKLAALLAEGVLLVDIRRKDEWLRTGIIKGSKTMTFFDASGRINPNFVSQLSVLTSKDKPIMLICQTGGRTQAVSNALVNQLGYSQVMNVTNGISGWIREKRDVIQYK